MIKSLYLKNFLIILAFCFIILQDCAILVGSQLLYISSILVILTLVIFLLINNRETIKNIKELYKKTPFKYLIWFVGWMLITSFFHGGFGTAFYIIFRVILIYCLAVVPASLFGGIAIPKTLSYKRTFNIFLFSYIAILIYGVIDYICRIFLASKPPLYNILCSRNYFAHLRGLAVNITGDLLDRASSIFFEPSFFSTFIFVFIPMVYVLVKSEFLIIKNKFLNTLFIIMLVVLSWICMFFTKSPIYIILTILYTIIFFIVDYKYILKKIYIFIPVLILILLGSSITIKTAMSSNAIQTNPIIQRINKTSESFGSLDKLVIKEESLATRVISTINTYQAATKVPLFGCGYGNSSEIMYRQYLQTKTPLTLELIEKGIYAPKSGPSPNIFWSLLLQTGFVGVFILYTFFIKTIIYSFKIRNFFKGINKILLLSLNYFAINYVIISFYWSIDSYPMMWFIFGILCSYILIYKKMMQIKQINIIDETSDNGNQTTNN